MIGYGSRSTYFTPFNNRTEQRLLESMSNEVARIYGVPCYYIARNFTGYDQLYGTTESESYTYCWQIAMVQKNVLGFTGDREFMDKFAGLQIRDQITFSIPRKTFEQVVAQDPNFPPLPFNLHSADLTSFRPREGDLIWYPFNQKCFKIVFVNKTDMFWQLGKLYTWEVTCELYEYSGEQFNTGIPEIDRIQATGSLNIFDWALTDTDGSYLFIVPYNDLWVVDKAQYVYPLKDNQVIETESNNYIDWNNSNIDPFADSNNVGDTF